VGLNENQPPSRELGPPSGGQVVRSVPREWLVRGYLQALERFQQASGDREAPDEMFPPLFEALSWAGSLEEELRPHEEPLLHGVRYARNCVLHRWGDALEARDFPAPTVMTNRRGGSRIIMPPTFWDWFWRDGDELPPPPSDRKDQKGRECYDEILAGKKARVALEELQPIFAPAP
jgi:hypothetical protein